MMAQKAQLFDESMVKHILNAPTTNEVKTLGRKVKNFDEEVWREKSFDIVVQGNLAKFSQHPKIKAFLLSMANRVLVEASPYDQIWGIGMMGEDERAFNPFEWSGENKLGFALMVVREHLMQELKQSI